MIRLPPAARRLVTPNFAWGAVLAGLALAVLGVNAIAGTTEAQLASRQAMWVVVGTAAMVALLLPLPRLIGLLSYPALALALLLLALLLVPGMPQWLVPVRNNARCWINLQFMLLQPSEFTKIAFVLALAWYLRYRENYRTLVGLLPPFVIMFVPVLLILKEPDLGSALVFAPALFFVLIAAGAKMRHLLSLVGLGLAALAVNVVIILYFPENLQVLKPYQQRRIVEFIDQEGFQQRTAMAVLGSGGLTGYGKTRSQVIVSGNGLPENHNDMIFAVVVNRWGLAGGLTVVGLYLVMVTCLLISAARLKEPFPRLATVGFAGLLAFQGTLNMAMPLGLAPITGITLPFVSYGGSSVLASMMMLGLAANFAARRPPPLTRPSFEYDHPDTPFQ